MQRPRHTWALPALALTLVLTACSTPEDLNAPTLEPQFGSGEDDVGFDVSVASNGRIFVLSEEAGTDYDYNPETDYGSPYDHENLSLRLYDTSGKFISSSFINSAGCNYDNTDAACAEQNLLKPLGLYADTKGFRYALYTAERSESIDFSDPYIQYYVTRLDASGNSPSTYEVGWTDYSGTVDAAVDSSGNIYVAKSEYNAGTSTYTNTVAKYSTNGVLLWDEASTVGTPYGITVSGSSNVYVVGDKGFARYLNGGGKPTWTKPGNFEEVIVSGSNLYTRYRKDIRKHDSNGNQLWLRPQSGLNTMIFQSMDGDGYGNVYLSGKYQASTGNYSPMVRKLNSSGSVLWTRTYGTTAYDDARGIATISGSEIYVAGETQGSLAHTNIGGRDGYLRKLNSSGNPLWTR